MSERRGTKALELWCKRMTEGYPGVKVENMTTSWRNGLAFCAIIHHFRPELIDFSKLNKDDIFYNNELAFTVAEKYLGIPALLEPEDMVEYDVPDRLSILTYLSQFYKAFVASQGSSPARMVPKRPASSTDRGGLSSPASTSPPTKMAVRGGVPRREPCAKCGNPVYIAERLNVGKLLYHRTCFRCARCNSQLTLANYYETETANQFCCETCPDEESSSGISIKSDASRTDKSDEKSMLSRSLSDEEKSAGLKKLTDQHDEQQQQKQDDYSTKFETALEDSSILKTSSLGSSGYSQARSEFLTTNFVDSSSDTEIPPELPKTKPPDIKDTKKCIESSSSSLAHSGHPENQNNFSEKSANRAKSVPKDNSAILQSNTHVPSLDVNIKNGSVNSSDSKRTNVISVNKSSAISFETVKSKYDDTKDKTQSENYVRKENQSLVKNRMKLFEKSTEISEEKSNQVRKLSKSSIEDQIVGKHFDGIKLSENLKRPLSDATVTSPEKKFSLEKKEFDKKEPNSSSAFLKTTRTCEPVMSSKMENSETTSNVTKKSPRELSLPQSKSLNFLLEKQIALREGKISPKALINETKSVSSTKAESTENLRRSSSGTVAKNSSTNRNANDNLKIEKRKSLENLLIKTKFETNKSISEKKSPSDGVVKPFSSRRNNSDNIKAIPFSEKKIAVEKISNTKNLSNVKVDNESEQRQSRLGKTNLERNRLPSFGQIKSNSTSTALNSNRIIKEQPTDNIPKGKLEMNRAIFNRHSKNGRKENLFHNPTQSKHKSIENLTVNTRGKISISDYDLNKNTFPDFPKLIRRASSESLLKSTVIRHPVVSSPAGYTKMINYDKCRNGEKTRMNRYMSDTELNNILNRKNEDWSAQLKRKSLEYIPMKSIENLYRSNSEESISYRSEKNFSENRLDYHQSRKNNVSSLKNKFECLSVVLSRPSSQSTTTDIDDQNNSVSEIQSEVSHGEILRDGHMTMETEMEGRDKQTEAIVEGTQVHRSESVGNNAETIDLRQDISPKRDESQADMSQHEADVIIISDDSVIEISDSLSFNKTTLSDMDATGAEIEKKSTESDEDYPEDLNPFGEDDDGNDVDEKSTEDDKNPFVDETTEETAKLEKVESSRGNKSLNPFEDDDDEAENEESKVGEKPTPAVRKKIVPLMEMSLREGDTPEYMRKVYIQRISVNPFEEDDDGDYEKEENEESILSVGETSTLETTPPRRLISAPRISLNPFWSDADEEEQEYNEENESRPVPKPRKFRNATGNGATPEPKPRTWNQSATSVLFGSNSSLSSVQSGSQSMRKKKPAPRPPIFVTETKTESTPDSQTSSPSTSVSLSPRLTTKIRKTKKAPLPPTSTPQLSINSRDSLPNVSPILDKPLQSAAETVHPELTQAEDVKNYVNEEEFDNEKVVKDKVNQNRRSQLLSLPDNTSDSVEYQEYIPNKSTYGKWKRKKGPAPSRPVPQRRMIKALPVSEFRKELELIELQKQGLEKQGVRLEQIIRDRCEGPDRDLDDSSSEDSVPIDVEDLILQLFEVVNEKNELSRREAELMYLQRQQRLEEEHAEVEYQIRCLMMQPEVNKTDSDKAKEEELIQRLVEIVERRNEIIECLEMDRLREAEEDDSISTSLNSYASRRDEQLSNTAPKITDEKSKQAETIQKKEKSKKVKKDKKNKTKKSHVVDADKDVDESETSIVSVKEKKKKKFALF